MVPAFRYWLANMGDHTVAAWMCVGAHLLAATCASREALLSTERSPERRMWASIGLLVLLVGANKQLDLQILAIKELGALFGQSPFWGNRRLIAVVILVALGVMLVRLFLTFARDVHARSWPVNVAACAAAGLASLVLARGTIGIVNNLLVTDLYRSVGDVLQVQVKDLLEISLATSIVVSCLAWRERKIDALTAR